MLRAADATRPLMYHQADGTGRDVHCHNIHYDEHKRNTT